ncbi:hypothetical protein RN001_014787 [Aquatica leii]|uniref:DUF4806 domain-containing protein n=1 Tax=Aquatica leii TaxID=1421715 RepID=A0AAN7SKR6_9COLE|nr:hypothetical protein RN001_014787 [Aquatica leii]
MLQFKLLNLLPKIDLNITPHPLACNRSTLEMARNKAADIECTTEDEFRRGRGYRKKKELKKFNLGDGSSSDEETRINLKAVPKLNILQHVSLSTASNKDIKVIATACESGDIQICPSNNVTITDEVISDFNDNAEALSTRFVSSTNELHCSPVDSNSTFDNQIKKYIDDNFAALQLHIDGKLQIVLQMLAETQLILNHIQGRFEQVPVQDPSQPLHEVMKCIPIDSADKLQSLELELNDPTSKNFLMLFMKKVGGTNGREFGVRNLRKIFVDSFASKTSWCGQRNNVRISNLKLIKLLQDVTDSIFKLTDKEFEKTASEWFRQSKQRTQRMKKNRLYLILSNIIF